MAKVNSVFIQDFTKCLDGIFKSSKEKRMPVPYTIEKLEMAGQLRSALQDSKWLCRLHIKIVCSKYITTPQGTTFLGKENRANLLDHSIYSLSM